MALDGQQLMMALKPSDHALALIKAGLNAVPIVGGAIASLIGDYIPMSTQRSLQAALESLTRRLEEVEYRIDPEAVDREQFAEVFKSCYLILVRTHEPRRREATIMAIVNGLLRPGDPEKLAYTELDHFIRCLERLSRGALDVIQAAVALARQHHRVGEDGTFRFTFDDLRSQVQIDPFLLLGLVGELNSVNLLHQPGLPVARDGGNLYGNYPLELTPLGVRFVDRLMKGVASIGAAV